MVYEGQKVKKVHLFTFLYDFSWLEDNKIRRFYELFREITKRKRTFRGFNY